jgi:uncharacterized protein (DUF1015 family)
MALIRPFRGVRPNDALAREVIAHPYDVVSEAEARALTLDNPRSFLRVTRPEVDLPAGSDPHGPEAYAKARENLGLFVREGWMAQDAAPGFYVYRLTWRGRTQTGLLALASVAEYDAGLIKKHELTRPDKEQDRVDHIEALQAQTGPVFLGYRDEVPEVQAALAYAASQPPAWSVTTEDGVQHDLIPVFEPAQVEALAQAFAKLPALYVADGHHRSAAASRVAQARAHAGSSGGFLAGLFPDRELEILAYNRHVKDLNGHTTEAFLAALEADFALAPHDAPTPPARGSWTMYLGGRWFLMTPKARAVPSDPVGRLDVAVLQDRVLAPLLGIANPRTDQRIAFVGGIRGHEALSQAVDRGEAAVAFHLYPTGMDQLFDVADAGMLMPPKSTWFEPKLREGVVIHALEP